MNYYQHHIGDFNNATRHLTRVERSLYRDLTDLYYDTEKPLDSDISKLTRKVMAHSEDEKTALNQVLDEFFTLEEDGYHNKRCDKELEKYHANSKAKSKAGKASAAKRQQNSTRVEQMNNGCATNQEPRTKNHKPTTKDQKKGKTFAPPSFGDVSNYCNERKNTIDPESFISFYESKGWMIGKNKMKSWKASIVTWEKRNGKENNTKQEVWE